MKRRSKEEGLAFGLPVMYLAVKRGAREAVSSKSRYLGACV